MKVILRGGPAENDGKEIEVAGGSHIISIFKRKYEILMVIKEGGKDILVEAHYRGEE